jgi:hypothetical protein
MPLRVGVTFNMTSILSIPFLLMACAAKPENPSFPISFSDAQKAVNEMRADPRPLARPLVIVGGFGDPNVSPPLFKSFFKSISCDQQIVTVSICFCQSFNECRQKVIEAVDKACPSNDPNFTAEVDVVGASLGGLAARYAATPSDDPAHPRRLKIARLFTISTPHTGATLAGLISITSYHRDMRPNSHFLNKLAQQDAQATYELYPYVLLHDEIVGVHNAAPPGVDPFWLPNPPLTMAHFGAMIDPRILADIARRLRGEEAFTQLPATPLPQSSL